MAVLSTSLIQGNLRRLGFSFIFSVLFAIACLAGTGQTHAETSKEYQLKAAFLYNFSQFVDWPTNAFADAKTPMVIGILGDDPFGTFLDDLVRGEKTDNHALVVQRYHNLKEVKNCHILFVCQSEVKKLDEVLAATKNKSILTVGDFEGFAKRGGMIRFITENNKIRFRINVASARTAGLKISSKLLRPAEVIGAGED